MNQTIVLFGITTADIITTMEPDVIVDDASNLNVFFSFVILLFTLLKEF